MPRKLKTIHPDDWSVRHFKSGIGLQIKCPTHNCQTEIFTGRKPNPFGYLLIECPVCCVRQNVLLGCWHAAPPKRDCTPTDPTDTRGT